METANSEPIAKLSWGEEILLQLKEKFPECVDSNEKYRILTTLPKSWSSYRIQQEFNVSRYMAERAKKLQTEQGVMTIPPKKLGSRTLEEETVSIVRDFFQSDDISRVCPGKRDYILTIDGEEKIAVQRRLVLCNLREAFEIFKEEFPNSNIGFSKFASNRPKNCILANSSGTHSVCVCVYHQNVKLMFDVLLRSKILPVDIKQYQDLFVRIVCSDSTEKCWLKTCNECPGTQDLVTTLVEIFKTNNISKLRFKQWQQVDRCMLELIEKEPEEFAEILMEKVLDLIPHHFIAEQQGSFLKKIKDDLKATECIIICDFSENFSFVVQDAVQGFHWANAQCTIHPFAIYFKDKSNQIQFTSYVAIAESGKHNHVAVRLFITHCLKFVIDKIPKLNKIFFFSYG